jgi:hypothetical protein
MEYANILHEAARVFNDRNPKYGDMRVGMERVAHIASMIAGINLTAYDVALVLHAVKLSRLGEDRRNPDHYIDGVNYLAFAGELVDTLDPEIGKDSLPDASISNIAARFSPSSTDAGHQGE